jgi:WD40 repeat protein
MAWQPRTCLCVAEQALQVHSVAWNCTGRKLASGSVDRTARIWDIRGVRCRARVT